MSDLIFVAFVVNARIFVCVAHPLQQCCFACIRSPNHENPEVGVLLSEFDSVDVRVAHCRSVGLFA